MSFRLVPKSVTLNGEMALILHYFTEFVYDVVVKPLLGLPRFQNLLWYIVYDHINTICAISQRLFRQNTLITRCDGRRCIDDWVHRLPLTRSYSRNSELSLIGVGSGLYMYDVVVKRSRSLSHLLMSSCYHHITAMLFSVYVLISQNHLTPLTTNYLINLPVFLWSLILLLGEKL